MAGGAEPNAGLQGHQLGWGRVVAPVGLPYPKEYKGYRPKGLLVTVDGFLLCGEVLLPATGWQLILTQLSPQLIPGRQLVLGGDRTNEIVGVRGLDSGYVLLANTTSKSGVLRVQYGIQDMNLLRLNPKGEVLWSAALGGTGLNQGKDVVVNDESSGAVTVLGSVNQGGGAIPRTYGDLNVIVARYKQSGELQWVTVLGGPTDDIPGGLVISEERTWVVYSSWSRGNHWQMYLVELDSAGKEVRRNEYGGQGSEIAAGLAKLADGDLLLLGSTDSTDDRYGKPRGKIDILLMRISERGKVRWQKRFGGSEDDLAQSLLVGQNGDCWVLGTTWSGDGDVPRHIGGSDVWLLRVGSKGELLDSRTYGTADDDVPLQILQGAMGPLALGATRISDDLAKPFLIVPYALDKAARNNWH